MQLSDIDFAVAVPFGFVTDAEGKLVIVGVALQRCLGVKPGMLVDSVFNIVRPARVSSLADLAISPTATVFLQAVHGELELKGRVVPLNDGDLAAFWGGAIVRDIFEFQQRGLQIGDFPPNDATPDLLLSMQATRASLDDARKLGRKLQSALLSAEAATEAKDRFLATISHEIRTPLNGFGSMIDLMSDSQLTEDQRQNLETMNDCTQSLLVLVNDILDFSKIEVGKIQVSPEPVQLSRAFRRIIELFRQAAEDRGIELRVEIDMPDDSWFLADVDRIRQVVSNLLDNALKFTPNGYIEFRVHCSEPSQIIVDVIDSGIGVDPSQERQVFEPFVQADASTTRRFGGAGLGLSISRQLAQAMGGNVEMVSSSAKGSHFRMAIQAETTMAPESSKSICEGRATPLTFEGVRILVAEDDQTNQLIARKMLEKIGATVTVVEDGLLAVEAAEKSSFDLILMDLMMPRLSGVEAVARIRSGHGPCSEIPILAFSAAAIGFDREAAIAVGMSGFIEKPARIAELRTALAEQLASRERCVVGK